MKIIHEKTALFVDLRRSALPVTRAHTSKNGSDSRRVMKSALPCCSVMGQLPAASLMSLIWIN
ncbi:hypothetical protein [Anaerobacterium chartisolvens]|uniref:hypothetical protein n=1 Tax=Anaerobacterium chartisolvens TaxID=1297424 RepID=UPI000DF23F12|nr:hypothetical protein [Anaerobacterium chartisolvens]